MSCTLIAFFIAILSATTVYKIQKYIRFAAHYKRTFKKLFPWKTVLWYKIKTLVQLYFLKLHLDADILENSTKIKK